MKTKNWFLGAASAAILVGSLVGVGCKSSSKNATATTTPQMQETTTPQMSQTPATTSSVTQTQKTTTYFIVLKIGPAEEMMMMSAATATSGEVMVPMPGMPTPSMMTSDQGQAVNHHLEIYIINAATGATVTDTAPAISITNTATNASRDLADVTQMYNATSGTSDTHFGNNLYLPDGQYTVTAKVGQETAQFTNVIVGNGPTPPTG